jgi:prepilin-type N-terminal cleavage/methylation domain-containing protein
MRRFRIRRLGADAGMSLTELLVTMFITSILIAGTATLVVGVSRTNGANIDRTDQVDTARVGVERMVQALRTSVMQSQLGCSGCTADAFIQGADYGAQFYANINNAGGTVGPSKVTYRIVTTGTGTGDLRQTIQRPDSATPSPTLGFQYTNTANIVDTVIARGVRTDTGAPMFAYFDGASARLVPTSGALTAAQLKNVLAIEVQLTVQTPSQRARPTTYVQRLLLPNAEAVIRQNEETSP